MCRNCSTRPRHLGHGLSDPFAPPVRGDDYLVLEPATPTAIAAAVKANAQHVQRDSLASAITAGDVEYLATQLKYAEHAHAEHELAHGKDENWPKWYAEFLLGDK